MKLDYFITDVFTHVPFSGAQVAVFPQADDLTEAQMQIITRELNLPETVFIFKPEDPEHHCKMRTFSPYRELDFAGHPILAVACVLNQTGKLTHKDTDSTLIFEQNSGPVEVHIAADSDPALFVQFSRKVTAIIDRFTPSDREIAEILSINPDDIDHKKYATRLVSCGFPYLIVPVWKYETVRRAKFNFTAWSQSAAPQTAAQEIMLFSPKTPFQDSDFNVRLFGPNIGINDDPAIGSAMPAFASYLASFDFIQEGTHTFTVDRGDKQSRRSVIDIEMDYYADKELGLRIGGRAVLVAQGTVIAPKA